MQLSLDLGDLRRDYIARLYMSGMTLWEIAECEKISPQAVCKSIAKVRAEHPGKIPHRPQWANQRRNRQRELVAA